MNLSKNYHQLLELIICDRNSKECMIHCCESCDRAELISCTLPLDEFIEQLCEQLDEITSHSFIARSQSQYLNKLKQNLKCHEVIILEDFAEKIQLSISVIALQKLFLKCIIFLMCLLVSRKIVRTFWIYVFIILMLE